MNTYYVLIHLLLIFYIQFTESGFFRHHGNFGHHRWSFGGCWGRNHGRGGCGHHGMPNGRPGIPFSGPDCQVGISTVNSSACVAPSYLNRLKLKQNYRSNTPTGSVYPGQQIQRAVTDKLRLNNLTDRQLYEEVLEASGSNFRGPQVLRDPSLDIDAQIELTWKNSIEIQRVELCPEKKETLVQMKHQNKWCWIAHPFRMNYVTCSRCKCNNANPTGGVNPFVSSTTYSPTGEGQGGVTLFPQFTTRRSSRFPTRRTTTRWRPFTTEMLPTERSTRYRTERQERYFWRTTTYAPYRNTWSQNNWRQNRIVRGYRGKRFAHFFQRNNRRHHQGFNNGRNGFSFNFNTNDLFGENSSEENENNNDIGIFGKGFFGKIFGDLFRALPNVNLHFSGGDSSEYSNGYRGISPRPPIEPGQLYEGSYCDGAKYERKKVVIFCDDNNELDVKEVILPKACKCFSYKWQGCLQAPNSRPTQRTPITRDPEIKYEYPRQFSTPRRRPVPWNRPGGWNRWSDW